ncbi:peptidoglycan-binding domain-containing protein [Streptomyces sp. MMBL 11-3]|uniref:peptidoglycan-binding domain-containing protein n=1 Tax=Streptomyces sp. MMBL 11-3 TaxID=3382639 RepID=UPI0039B37E3A
MRTVRAAWVTGGIIALAATGLAPAGPAVAIPATGLDPAPYAEPYCTYLDDNARPVIRDRAPGPPGAVLQVQCLINTYSGAPAPLPLDGNLGLLTRAAIRFVQTCNQVGEPPGVIVGAPTWEALYHPAPNCARSHT